MNPTSSPGGAHHQMLRRLTGAWTARIKHYVPGQAAPVESSGEFLARMDVGGQFLCRDVNFGLQGFQGRGLTGYDPFEKAFVGTWVDSESPIIYRTLGRFDEKGIYCEESEGRGPDGGFIRVRMTTEVVGRDEMLFQMFHTDEAGEERKILEIEHMRRRFVD